MKFSNSKRAINYLALLLVLFLSLNLNISCDTTEQQSKVKILLEAEDASCTEAWLNLKIESIALPIEITLFQGDSLLFTTNINSSDTTLFVENLLPNQNYSFYSTIEQFNNGTIKSNSISVTTMDTTSHNFTWETYEFGEQGTSYFKDVAIINENDIWAVGEIHTAETDQFDSNGVWVKPYNAVHWDGVKWELKRIMFYTFCNQEHKAPYPASAIFSFSDSSVAITSGSQITFVKDEKQKGIECIPVSVTSIWGTTSQDFYVVGNGGNIAHYNGSKWTKIESGTELDLKDITNTEKANYASGYSIFTGESILLKINGYSSSSVWQDNSEEAIEQFGEEIHSVEGFNKILFIGSNKGIIECFVEQNMQSKLLYKTRSHIAKIFGSSINNVFTAGYQSNINHFNGKTTQNIYSDFSTTNTFYSGHSSENMVAGVGTKVVNAVFSKAIITIGRKI